MRKNLLSLIHTFNTVYVFLKTRFDWRHLRDLQACILRWWWCLYNGGLNDDVSPVLFQTKKWSCSPTAGYESWAYYRELEQSERRRSRRKHETPGLIPLHTNQPPYAGRLKFFCPRWTESRLVWGSSQQMCDNNQLTRMFPMEPSRPPAFRNRYSARREPSWGFDLGSFLLFCFW